MISIFAIIGIAIHADVVIKADIFNVAKFFIINAVNGGWMGYVFLRYGLLGSMVVHYLFDLILIGMSMLFGG